MRQPIPTFFKGKAETVNDYVILSRNISATKKSAKALLSFDMNTKEGEDDHLPIAIQITLPFKAVTRHNSRRVAQYDRKGYQTSPFYISNAL